MSLLLKSSAPLLEVPTELGLLLKEINTGRDICAAHKNSEILDLARQMLGRAIVWCEKNGFYVSLSVWLVPADVRVLFQKGGQEILSFL